MVKHIVLFRLKKNMPANEREKVMKDFKEAIEALPNVISFIRKIEVGLNINADEQWDIALYSEFDTLDDVRAYAIHPEHRKAAAILADVKEARSCVDYNV